MTMQTMQTMYENVRLRKKAQCHLVLTAIQFIVTNTRTQTKTDLTNNNHPIYNTHA